MTKLQKAKAVWDREKGRIAIVSTFTAIVMTVGWMAAARSWNDFLSERGLMDDFYPFED